MKLYTVRYTYEGYRDSKILETFTNKQEALAAGVKYRAEYTREQGIISCIQAEFDESNNIVGNKYKLIDAWR